jgi:hypothetical protein
MKRRKKKSKKGGLRTEFIYPRTGALVPNQDSLAKR